MSRAFVKESDGEELLATRARRQHSERPNYVTPLGFDAMRARLERLIRERASNAEGAQSPNARAASAQLDDDIQYLSERLDRAIVVEPPPPPWTRVNVGATVELADADGESVIITLVGEDETDVARGRISWCSPLGHATMLREVGDEVLWQRPAGDRVLEILNVRYDRERSDAE